MSCLRGRCCEPFRADLMHDFPPDVRYVSVYSRSDGIVDWRSCLDGPPTSSSRSAPRTAGWPSASAAYEQVARAPAAFDEPVFAARRLAAFEQRDGLDVRRLREHVDRDGRG